MRSRKQNAGTSPGVFFTIAEEDDPLNGEEIQEYRSTLDTILSEGAPEPSETLRALLDLGAEWMGVEHGYLARIDPVESTHTIVEGRSPALSPGEGATTDLSATYCRKVLIEGKALAVMNAPEQGWAGDRAYQKFDHSTYFGAKVVVDGELYGTVCFADREPRREAFQKSDAAALGLIVQALERILEQCPPTNREESFLPIRAEGLFEGVSDMVYLHDREGNLLFSTPRLSRKTGYAREELGRMKVWEIDRDRSADEARALWQDVDSGEVCRFDAHFQCHDGSSFPVEVQFRGLDRPGRDLFVASARDVSDRKEQERALRREKERFESLVQEVEEYAIFMLDPEGRVQSWNAGARRIKGYEEEEIIGQSFTTFYTEEDRTAEVPEENLRQAEREGSVQDEGWRVRKDGSRFWANVTITALREDDGSLRGFAKVTRDMTNRNQRERRYEAIFNQTYQFIGLMEPDGTLLEANETALQFGGLEREEVIDKPFWETYWWQISEETQQELREAIERAAEGEFVRYDVEVQGGDQNIVIDFSIRPVFDEEGEVTLLIPEGRNITELKSLKQRERQLRRTQNLLAQAQQLAHVGGWRIDVREGPPYVPEWTDELHSLFEISPDETLTVDELLEFFPPGARAKREKAIERALESGEGWDQESRMVTAKGNERWVRSIGEAEIEDGDVIALHGALQDITERKEREQRLERQNRQLDQFASLVSHDLRAPLHVLKGRLDLAQEEDDPAHLAAAERALGRMEAIIDDLLMLTWGGQDLDSEELGMHSLASVARESWDHVDTASGTLQLVEDLKFRAEEGRLRRLLENLFRNAIEHGGEAVTVRVGALNDGFFVADDGPGIPEEKRDKVLEGGYSSREEGTGLGLSIVQEIVETHGWELSITDSREGGARFEVTGVQVGSEDGGETV